MSSTPIYEKKLSSGVVFAVRWKDREGNYWNEVIILNEHPQNIPPLEQKVIECSKNVDDIIDKIRNYDPLDKETKEEVIKALRS